MKRKLAWIAVILLPVIVLGGVYTLSRDVTVRNREWPTQMEHSPAPRSQTAITMLGGISHQLPVAGTIPRGFQPFRYGPTLEEGTRAGNELRNPFPATEENLARGRYIYTNQCVVCHGARGNGDGPLIPRYPNPPSFNSEKVREMPEGAMFHVITMGFNKMPSHAAQVPAEDRWKVILYIRQLQGKVN